MTGLRPFVALFSVAVILAVLAACADDDLDELDARLASDAEGRLEVTSEAFLAGETIPSRYTCDGDDVSPPLAIAGLPSATAALAIVVDDPDAPKGTWVHWIEFNVPAVERIEEGAASLGRPGRNSWNEHGYRGPCPPSGEHRYFFKVYALDEELSLPDGADRAALLDTIEGHVLAYGELMGTYRSR